MSESIAYQVRDGHNFRIPEDITACQVLLRTTRREIRLLEKDAVTHRDNEQQEKLREATKKGDKTTAKAIKFKMVAETTKRMFRKLQSCRGKKSTGLSRLEVPKDPTDSNYKDCTEWVSIDAPEEIEAKLISRNQSHFGQAHGSFPTKPFFSEWVDWGASSHTSELILEGEFHDETR